MISCHCCCCRFSIHKRATITAATTSTTRADTPKQVKDGGGRCVQLIKYTKKCVESGGGRKKEKKLVHALIYPYWIIEAASKPANKQVSEHTRVWGLDIFFFSSFSKWLFNMQQFGRHLTKFTSHHHHHCSSVGDTGVVEREWREKKHRRRRSSSSKMCLNRAKSISKSWWQIFGERYGNLSLWKCL